MEPFDPIDELMADHRLIEKVLTALDAQLDPEVLPFPAGFLGEALDFIAHFADGHHHFKEEEALFPAMAKRGVPVEGGPIGMMLFEHAEGRKHVQEIRRNLDSAGQGDAESQAAVRKHAREYTALLRNHIWKEDNVLFRMARQALGPEALESLARQFRDEANPRVSSETRRRYAEFANSL